MAIKTPQPGCPTRTGVVRAPCGHCLWSAASGQARLASLPQPGSEDLRAFGQGCAGAGGNHPGSKRRKRHEMVKETIAAMLVVTGVAVVSAREGDVIARFDGGIGVIPVTGGAGSSKRGQHAPERQVERRAWRLACGSVAYRGSQGCRERRWRHQRQGEGPPAGVRKRHRYERQRERVRDPDLRTQRRRSSCTTPAASRSTRTATSPSRTRWTRCRRSARARCC